MKHYYKLLYKRQPLAIFARSIIPRLVLKLLLSYGICVK